MLACLEDQVTRANGTKQANTTHQKQIEQKVNNKHANYSYHLKVECDPIFQGRNKNYNKYYG